MSSDLLPIFLLSLAAMANPSLLAAVTTMLLLPKPRPLMTGYLLGAYTTSITTGLVIVFALPDSGAVNTSRHTISPLVDVIVGFLLLSVAFVLRTGRDRGLQERRHRRKDAKLRARRQAGKPAESLPLRMLGKGDPRVTFVVGVVLSFPGVSYFAALTQIRKLHASSAVMVLVVIAFCVIQLLLLELPLAGYVLAPERTPERVNEFRSWMARKGRTAAVIGSIVLGAWLLIRGVLTLL